MSSMGDNTKSADVSISVESVDDQSSSIPPPKIATTATEPPLSKKSRVSEASTKTQNKSWVWDHYDIVEGFFDGFVLGPGIRMLRPSLSGYPNVGYP
ncbi:hypothetical protein ACH5RR_017476 [Cinchona calisaya]|uniref:Uncharacterized protein n=1 Tax=Cinchona calisaya TaxID=153742 RepID=A0ABD2ZIN5_9GENT